MSMFDPFQQAKLQGAYSKLKDTKIPEKDMSLDDLKRLSGAGKITGESTPIDHELNAKKAQYIRENNIKPGDQAWFKVMFAKPHLTGEDPFSK
jgi:hypothetical protein